MTRTSDATSGKEHANAPRIHVFYACAVVALVCGSWLTAYGHSGDASFASYFAAGVLGSAAFLSLAGYAVVQLTRWRVAWVFAAAPALIALFVGVGIHLARVDRDAQTPDARAATDVMESKTIRGGRPLVQDSGSSVTASSSTGTTDANIVDPWKDYAPPQHADTSPTSNSSVAQAGANASDQFDATSASTTSGPWNDYNPPQSKTTKRGDFEAAARVFERGHADIFIGDNLEIMQLNLGRLDTENLTPDELLQAAYEASRNDPQWVTSP